MHDDDDDDDDVVDDDDDDVDLEWRDWVGIGELPSHGANWEGRIA